MISDVQNKSDSDLVWQMQLIPVKVKKNPHTTQIFNL